MNYKTGIILEGVNDAKLIRRVFPNTHIVLTKGTRLNNRVRMDIIYALNNCRNVFLLTDPDEAGNLLANMVLTDFPTLRRLVLDYEMCKCHTNRGLKYGIEHAEPEYLLSALSNYLV